MAAPAETAETWFSTSKREGLEEKPVELGLSLLLIIIISVSVLRSESHSFVSKWSCFAPVPYSSPIYNTSFFYSSISYKGYLVERKFKKEKTKGWNIKNKTNPDQTIEVGIVCSLCLLNQSSPLTNVLTHFRVAEGTWWLEQISRWRQCGSRRTLQSLLLISRNSFQNIRKDSKMYHPSRGGVRGGQDQFDWEDVKADKYRENYLGESRSSVF